MFMDHMQHIHMLHAYTGDQLLELFNKYYMMVVHIENVIHFLLYLVAVPSKAAP